MGTNGGNVEDASAVQNELCRRANVGCGASPTRGWLNFDSSLTVRLARYPFLLRLLDAFGLIANEQLAFASIIQQTGIQFGNVSSRLPLDSGSVDVVYSSHMLEHLSRAEAKVALAEFNRVLEPGGVLRLVVPDIRRMIDTYLASGDADQLVSHTQLAWEHPRTVTGRLRALLVGDRGHRWMYDGPSLVGLVEGAGFVDVVELPPGSTTISNPGQLDLHERSDESIYVEAHRE